MKSRHYFIGYFLWIGLVASSCMGQSQHGILGKKAPELELKDWIGKDGKPHKAIQLSDWKGKVVVMEFFQSWCPGCLSHGLPAMKKISDAFEDNPKVKFVTIQTVFEGHQTNTRAKLREIQKRFKLRMPMAHDAGTQQNGNKSIVMKKYRSGGTPWAVLIDSKGTVVFNDFQIDADKTIKVIRKMIKEIK